MEMMGGEGMMCGGKGSKAREVLMGMCGLEELM